MGEIQPLPIPRPGIVVAGHQLVRQGFQFRAEAQLPGAGLQRRQVVGLPLPQIHQQMANGSGIRGALGPLQGLAKLRWERCCGVAGSPLVQQLQLRALARGKLPRIDRLALAQQPMPLLLGLMG